MEMRKLSEFVTFVQGINQSRAENSLAIKKLIITIKLHLKKIISIIMKRLKRKE